MIDRVDLNRLIGQALEGDRKVKRIKDEIAKGTYEVNADKIP